MSNKERVLKRWPEVRCVRGDHRYSPMYKGLWIVRSVEAPYPQMRVCLSNHHALPAQAWAEAAQSLRTLRRTSTGTKA